MIEDESVDSDMGGTAVCENKDSDIYNANYCSG